MPFTKQGEFTDKVTNLPDKPTSSNYTATQIKTAIQQPSEDLKNTLNSLVDGLNANTGADNVGAKNEHGQTTTVQRQLDNLYFNKASVEDLQYTDNRIDNIVANAGDSNTEVVDARYDSVNDQTYTTVGGRLNNLSSQLAQTVKKSNLHTSGELPSDSVGVDGDLWFVVPALSQRYFVDKFTESTLNTLYWQTVATSGTPSFSIVSNKMVFDSSTALTDKGVIVAKKYLPTDKDATLKFRFIPSDQSRSDGGLVTPVIQRAASQPTSYMNNFFFFTVDATTGTIEYRGIATVSGVPQAVTNECEITVEIDSVNSVVNISCRDVVTNTQLFYVQEKYADKGIITGDKLWFTPALDDSTTFSYIYKFTRVEQL